jgi:hypothetical protein
VDKIILENDPKTPNMEPIIENINKYIKSPTSTHLNDRFIRVSSDNDEVQPINHEELMKLKNKKRVSEIVKMNSFVLGKTFSLSPH